MLVLAAVLWSLNGPAVKVLGELPAFGYAMWRSAGAAVAAAAFVLVFGRRAKVATPPRTRLAVAAVLYTANTTLLVFAMRAGTAASGILLQYTGPAWVALLGWLIFRRTVGPRTAVALALAGAGVVTMLLGTRVAPAGLAFGLCSGLSYGGLILALDAVGDRLDPARTVLFLNAAAVAVLLPLGVATGGLGLDLGAGTIAFMLGFGVVQLAVPYALFQLALRRVGPTRAAIVVLLEPVLNPLWTWLAVSEAPDAATLAGGGLLLAALLIGSDKSA